MLFPSSIQCLDSNPQTSEHESPPIITRPGLPPRFLSSFNQRIFIFQLGTAQSLACIIVNCVSLFCFKEYFSGRIQIREYPMTHLTFFRQIEILN